MYVAMLVLGWKIYVEVICMYCVCCVCVCHPREKFVKNGDFRGAVSKAIFENQYSLKPSVTVSPKRLSPEEKYERWLSVWSKVVNITE